MAGDAETPRPVDAAFRAPDLRSVWAEPSYSGAQSFFRRRFTHDLTGVDLAFWGIPLDVATSYRPGARFGPQAVRRISAMWEPADPVWPSGLNPFERLACIDYGDAVWDFGRPESALAAIRAQADRVLAAGATLISIGGDHALTAPLLESHAARHGPLALVHCDAHPDTWDDDGARLDHGVFALRAARAGWIDVARSVQIGLRTLAPNDPGLMVIGAEEVMQLGVARTADAIRARVGEGPAYLSVDIDVLDPAFAPGTGTPVPGGLSSRELLGILRRLSSIAFVGYDVVEVSPPYDHADLTANAAAAVAQTCAVLAAQRLA